MNKKPPTQGIGVQGFKADLYATDEKPIRWDILIHLPKFQMFAVEVAGSGYGDHTNVMEWIMGFVQDKCYQDEQAFFGSYTRWHDQKGYWKNEDVYGQPIGE